MAFVGSKRAGLAFCLTCNILLYNELEKSDINIRVFLLWAIFWHGSCNVTNVQRREYAQVVSPEFSFFFR